MSGEKATVVHRAILHLRVDAFLHNYTVQRANVEKKKKGFNTFYF